MRQCGHTEIKGESLRGYIGCFFAWSSSLLLLFILGSMFFSLSRQLNTAVTPDLRCWENRKYMDLLERVQRSATKVI